MKGRGLEQESRSSNLQGKQEPISAGKSITTAQLITLALGTELLAQGRERVTLSWRHG